MVLGVLNVLISIAIVTVFTSVVLGWELIYGLLLGAIVGGTSSSIVLSLAEKLKVPERISTLLSLESVFTDAIVIVLSITFLDIITETKALVLSEIAKSIASTLSIGIVFGLIFGIVWLKFLSVVRNGAYDDILTLSMAILFYGVTEALGGNGAIFALVFGLVLGNGVEIGSMLRIEGMLEIDTIMRKFMNQISFFIRTYFFVYLGLILLIEQRIMILYSVVLSLLLLGGRFLGVAFTSFRDAELKKYTYTLSLMMPRGLAAAIMAQFVVEGGIEHASVFPDLILIIIITTVIICSLGNALLKLPDLNEQVKE
jgi:Na+:H+ antiporter